MLESVLAAGMAAIVSLLQLPPGSLDPYQRPAQEGAKYKCEKHKWTKKAQFIKGDFYGEITSICVFEGMSGGGFPELNAYFIERIEKEAKKIHKGPIKGLVEAMPSVYYDTTTEFDSKDGKIVTRQDSWVATDEISRLLAIGKTKDIQATGNAKYLKAASIRSDVRATKKVNVYTIKVITDSTIKKPFLIPRKVFVREIKKALDKQMPKIEKQVINDIARHI